MLVGIGIDSVLISRISAKMSRAFIQRFLKQEERLHYEQLRHAPHLQVDYVAKLWAIKESCVKAWPHSTSIMTFTIGRKKNGYLLLNPQKYKCKLSVTNDKQRVMAICILES